MAVSIEAQPSKTDHEDECGCQSQSSHPCSPAMPLSWHVDRISGRQGAFLHYSDGNCKAIATFRDGFDVGLLMFTGSERLAQDRDIRGQIRFINESIGPHLV